MYPNSKRPYKKEQSFLAWCQYSDTTTAGRNIQRMLLYTFDVGDPNSSEDKNDSAFFHQRQISSETRDCPVITNDK
jgi:hypothetical protein